MNIVKEKPTDLLYLDLVAAGFEPKREYAFHGQKNWRFDFAFDVDAVKLAIEVDGRGRHQTPKGYNEDAQKLNAALEGGWRVLRYPSSIVGTKKRRERIIEQIKRVLCGVECEESAACVIVGE